MLSWRKCTLPLFFGLAASLWASSFAFGNGRTFAIGLWPNRVCLMDEESESIVTEIRLRYGASTSYAPAAQSPDSRHLYYVTDRMEAVEVVDLEKREVVDELRLSTPSRMVRIYDVSPDPRGKLLYLRVSASELGIDRFEPVDFDVMVYDLESREVKESFRLPREMYHHFGSPLQVSSDGQSLFALGRDVYQLNASDGHILRTLGLLKPAGAGYGPIRVNGMNRTEPSVYYGIYTMVEPAMKKSISGVVRIDVEAFRMDTFELGPPLRADLFALAPDGKHAYAGLLDLVKIDLEKKRIVAIKKDFEQGRTNTALFVSSDGTKLFVSGVGDYIQVVNADTLEPLRKIELGADLMSPAVELQMR